MELADWKDYAAITGQWEETGKFSKGRLERLRKLCSESWWSGQLWTDGKFSETDAFDNMENRKCFSFADRPRGNTHAGGWNANWFL